MSIPAKVIDAVWERASSLAFGHICEACGLPVWEGAFHHRLLRSAGGLHTVENLMFVHGGITGGCHNLTEYSIHQNPARSYRLGHMVRRGTDPATVPVIVARDLRELRA